MGESSHRIGINAAMPPHGLYAQFGFTPLKAPYIFMEIHQPDIYKSKT